jgi:hypothetical protein
LSFPQTCNNTYQHIYLEAAAWLQNNKVIGDLSVMLASRAGHDAQQRR